MFKEYDKLDELAHEIDAMTGKSYQNSVSFQLFHEFLSSFIKMKLSTVYSVTNIVIAREGCVK